MSGFADMAEIARHDEPMAPHTTFGVGGVVCQFVEPRTVAELAEVWRWASESALPLKVLGRGSNVLVADGHHDWLVVSTARLDGLTRDGATVRAGAGVPLARLLAAAGAWGLGGLEHLAGIPASVGGAVAMNAGGRGGEIASRLVGAEVLERSGERRWLDRRSLGLRYRGSAVRDGFPLIVEATFALEPDDPRRLSERRREFLRAKRASQPLGARSAGCVFKNPEDHSAGKLIDQAGLKGARVGGAVVSHKHANFIINRNGATASDVLELIEVVRRRVHDAFGIELELEIEIWNEGAPEGGTA